MQHSASESDFPNSYPGAMKIAREQDTCQQREPFSPYPVVLALYIGRERERESASRLLPSSVSVIRIVPLGLWLLKR